MGLRNKIFTMLTVVCHMLRVGRRRAYYRRGTMTGIAAVIRNTTPGSVYNNYLMFSKNCSFSALDKLEK